MFYTYNIFLRLRMNNWGICVKEVKSENCLNILIYILFPHKNKNDA